MAETATRFRPSPEALLAERRDGGPRQAQDLPRRGPRRRQDLRDARGGRRRAAEGVDVVVARGRDPWPAETAALLRRPRGAAAPARALQGPASSRRWTSTRCSRGARSWPWSTSWPTSNAPGSRHPKRWQDVEELLAAGIDVWTTLNVQHVESLNDVVAQITGVRVRETVPDRILDAAEDRAGRPHARRAARAAARGQGLRARRRPRRALEHFFSQGNLTALRELALRRTAERVDDQMVQYMRAHGLAGPWAGQRAHPGLRHGGAGRRRAGALRQAAGGPAARRPGRRCTSSPPRPTTGEADQDRVAETLRLAERLGGESLVLPGERVADEALAWARGQQRHPDRHRQHAPPRLARPAAASPLPRQLHPRCRQTSRCTVLPEPARPMPATARAGPRRSRRARPYAA